MGTDMGPTLEQNLDTLDIMGEFAVSGSQPIRLFVGVSALQWSVGYLQGTPIGEWKLSPDYGYLMKLREYVAHVRRYCRNHLQEASRLDWFAPVIGSQRRLENGVMVLTGFLSGSDDLPIASFWQFDVEEGIVR